MEELNEELHLKLLNFKQEQWENWARERKPFSVLFELTPKCNLNCIHCYLKNVHSSKQLSYRDIISILDILYDQGILFLIFTGGEILSRKDFLDIYMYAKEKGFLIELFSNGVLFSDEIIMTLKKFPPLYIDVTLYGACENTYRKTTQIEGAFEKVLNNCKKIKEAGINLSLRSPIIKETENEMNAMQRIAKKLNVPFICTFEICPTIDYDNSPLQHQVHISTMLKYEFDDYYYQVNKGVRKDEAISESIVEEMKNDHIFSCNVAMNSFVIDFNGNMCPCMKLKHHGVNLLANKFNEIWEEFSVYTKMKSSNSYKCRDCEGRYYCDICPAEMEFMFGDYEYRSPDMCNLAMFRKEFYCKERTYREVLKAAREEEKAILNNVQN